MVPCTCAVGLFGGLPEGPTGLPRADYVATSRDSTWSDCRLVYDVTRHGAVRAALVQRRFGSWTRTPATDQGARVGPRPTRSGLVVQPSDPCPGCLGLPDLSRQDTTWPDILGHILGHLRP